MKKQMNMMIGMRIIYSIFKSFILIFVNIYLWKTGKSMESVAIFNIFNYIAATVSFYFANIIALKNLKYNYFISSICFMIAFGLTAYLGADIARFALLIGVLGGCGDGFFFFNLNSFQASQLPPDDMDRFMSVTGALNKASAIITPIVSGFVIEALGFNAMLYSLLGLLVIQLVMAMSLESHHISSMMVLKWPRSKEERRVLLTNTIMSPYTQFTSMANSVFLYTLVAREAVIGTLNASFSIFSIAMFALYRGLQRKLSRSKLMILGAASSSLVLLLLVWPNLWTFILFGLLISIGGAMYQTPLVGVQLRSAKDHGQDEAHMLGNLLKRVIMLNTGRVIFFILVYFFYQDFSSSIFIYFLAYNMLAPGLSYRLGRKTISAY